VSDLFTSLFFRHDGVLHHLAGDLGPGPAVAAVVVVGNHGLPDQLFLEESRADVIVQHPNDRFDYIRFFLPGRGIDVPLQVHFHRHAEPSISDEVERAAVPAAHYVVRSRRFHDAELGVMIRTARRIRLDGSGKTVVVVVIAVVTAVVVTVVVVTVVVDGVDDVISGAITATTTTVTTT